MIRRSADRLLATMLAYFDHACDECGTAIDAGSARVVTDETGTFPVCSCCSAKF